MSASGQYPLEWVDSFIESIRPYVHVRPQDRLVIMVPNQAYKMNESAISILQRTFNGESAKDISAQALDPEQARSDLYHFFCDLKALVAGCLGNGRGRKAVEHIPMESPFTTLPVLSEIAVTYKCNLACKFCYAGCNCTRQDCGEMTTQQVKDTLTLIRQQADVPSVSFTGGEPTLREDLPGLISFARSIDMRVNLISNGTKIDRNLAHRLSDAGLNSAQISIEAASAEKHDQLTQVTGSFSKTINGIHQLQAHGINTQTNTTLNTDNVDQAVDIVELIHSLGLRRFAMNMLTPSGSAFANRDLFVSYSEIGQTVLAVKKRAEELEMQFLWYSPTPYCIFNPITESLGNKSCAACDGLLSIDPEGNVLPCSSFDYGVGNVLKEEFEKIWFSAQAEYWRHKQYAPDQCENCSSFIACAGACPLYWQACGTSELDLIKQEAAG